MIIVDLAYFQELIHHVKAETSVVVIVIVIIIGA